jgi:GNAT superfamily N-acetyltransferase
MDDLRALYDRDVRRQPQGGEVEVADGVIRVIAEGWRAVLWTDLDATTADAVIAREVERFAGLGHWEWKLFSYDQPPDLADRLRAAGFVPEEEEALLVGDLEQLDLDSPVPDGVELVPVIDERGVDLLLGAHDDVWGGHEEGYRRWIVDDIAAGRTEAVVAMAGGRPICGGRIEFQAHSSFAGLFGGSTVPEWRRRGVFRAVVAYRARRARERGYRYLHVDASNDSRPILERLGFVHLATTTPFNHN